MLGRSTTTVRRYIVEGRLGAERTQKGYSLKLAEVEELARTLETTPEEEVFEGEVMGEESEAPARLPGVPLERYERLLQQGQDYKTRLDERTRQMEEIRRERDAARTEIDRLWSELERLNLVEFQRSLQEKSISTLEEEKKKLEAERERLIQERFEVLEEKAGLLEERIHLEAEIRELKSRGFWARLFGRS